MKYERLTKYLTGILQLDHLSDMMHEDLCDKLDKIWYSMTDEEHDYMNSLRDNNQHLSKDTRIRNALEELKQHSTEELTMTETKTYNNVFENREDYQKLRAFWKQFHADGKHKAVKEEYRTSKPGESGWGNGELAYHKVSPLNAIHHAIYLAAMGKNLKKAFGSMDVRGPNYDVLLNAAWWGKTRIENGMEPNGTAIWNLFEDSIDVKYRLAILQRVNCYLKGHAE